MWLLLATLVPQAAHASDPKPTFVRSQIDIKFKWLQTADVNGDGLLDILLTAEDGLHVFLQDAEKGFSLQRQVTWSPKGKARALWPTCIGPDPAAQVLVLTSEGLSSLRIDGDGVHEQPLIQQETIIPADLESGMIFFPLAIRTAGEYPLLLLPTTKALEIWRHTEKGWQRASSIPQATQTTVVGPFGGIGYDLYRFENLAIGDLNGDGLDDMVIREITPQRDHIRLKLYLQDASGMLPSEPSAQYDAPFHWYEWISLQDVNGDGRCDLVRSTWDRYPLVLPGISSGKVIVRVYLADKDGKWPEKPSYTFRKHDWHAPVPMVDIDGSGHTSMVLTHYQWKGREELVEAAETHHVQFDLRVHMFDAETGYPAEPTFVTKVTGYVDVGHGGLGIDWDVFRRGFSLNGDFNGDGKQDLLVRDSKNEACVRFFQSRKEGFSARADLRFALNTDKDVQMIPEELNGDDISDLLVIPDDRSSLIVFTSKGMAAKPVK